MDEQAISFGPYRLLAARRLLLEGGKPVRLGSRAFDILATLVERAGEVVSKEELTTRAWPQTFVEDSNLRIQVTALRRALGDGQAGNRFIVTIPGRGYNFVAPVSLEEPSQTPPPPAVVAERLNNLPLMLTRMIGRDETVAPIVSRLSRQRLVTVVGAGGIGKTTVALAVAERVIADYDDGVWLVDLAPLADRHLVPSAVATVLGLEIHTEDPLTGLVAGIRDKRMLLLLDNCEHVIDAAVNLAETILGGAPGVNILATSREPLRAVAERVYRLGPLDIPPPSPRVTAAEAARFPAVQLFVERVMAVVEDFALSDANAPLISEICRRLDGLPLAIEFAAPRVAALGVEGLAIGLDESLPLLTARRRTAMPRHRTIRAVVDWSYGFLSEGEQQFFRALGIFAGGFTVEAAAAVTIDAADAPGEAIDRLADLVAKSLVVADVGEAKPRFRLLDTTRAYAIEKLDESKKPDLVYVNGPGAASFKGTAVPVVTLTGNPLVQGIAESLAHPGGNITGVSVDAGPSLQAKRIELLRELAPGTTRLGVIVLRVQWEAGASRVIPAACDANGLPCSPQVIDPPTSALAYSEAIGAAKHDGADALMVADNPDAFLHSRAIIDAATATRLPAMYFLREFVDAGGLAAYAFDLMDLSLQAAREIDAILRGANPADIPFYQNTKFNLYINMKTATMLGLTVSPALLARADEVIE